MPTATSGHIHGVSVSSAKQNGNLPRLIAERWWHERRHEIVQSGYKPRPRYTSRLQRSLLKSGRQFATLEEDQRLSGVVMDAIHIQDQLPVILKKVPPAEPPHELGVNQFFSSPELVQRSDNHCVPMLDVVELQHSGPHQLLVFPHLLPFHRSRIRTLGDFVVFFTQMCEGIRFMHQRDYAYGNCTIGHIKFDPSGKNPNDWPDPSQINSGRDFMGSVKRRCTRTQGHPRYYLADLGLSRHRTRWNAPDRLSPGGDMLIPEGRLDRLNDPFGMDIYCLGTLVRENFLQRYHGFEFVRDLVDAMTDENPELRPNIEQVVERLALAGSSLSEINLRSTFVLKDPPLSRTTRLIHAFWYNLRRRSSMVVP